MVVRSASATNLAAPRAEFAEPFRSRVATITGADDPVDTVAEQRVQAFDAAVAVAGALLGVAERGPHRVVDIDIRHVRADSDEWAVAGQAGHEAGGDRVELPDVPEPERPQERAQRRRRPHPVEQPGHPAMPEHPQVGDRVRTGDHPRHDRGHLRPGSVPGPTRHGQEPVGQLAQAGPRGQRHRRCQAGVRHQSRVVEHR